MSVKNSYALHAAMKLGDRNMLDSILKKGVNPNSKNPQGETPLQIAITTMCNDSSIVKLLQSYGADINATDVHKNTLLHLAGLNAKSGCDVIELLADSLDIDSRNTYGETPLHMAARSCNAAAIRVLLDKGADPKAVNLNKDTILHLAVANVDCRTSIIKRLVTSGIDINKVNKQNRNALQTFVLTNSQSLDVFKELIAHGANIKAKDNEDNTVLHLAVSCEDREDNDIYCYLKQKGICRIEIGEDLSNMLNDLIVRNATSVDVVKELITQGADIGARNKEGDTPLHLAVSNKHPNKNIIAELIQGGADINAQSGFGRTPLHAFCANSLQSLDVLKELISNGARANDVDETGYTPLHRAVENRNCNPDIVKVFVAAGSPINNKNQMGNYPLHSFCFLPKRPCELEIMDELHGRKDNVDKLDLFGFTPLFYAAGNSCACIVKRLLETGANPNGAKRLGSPLYNALLFSVHRFKTIKELLHNGADPNTFDTCNDSILFNFFTLNNLMDTDLLELLLRNGASTDYIDENGKTIFSECAAAQKKIQRKAVKKINTSGSKPPVCCELIALVSKFALIVESHQDIKRTLKSTYMEVLCPDFENYLNRCVAEMEEIKGTSVSNGVSLHMIFKLAVRYCTPTTKQLLKKNVAPALEIVSQKQLSIYGKDIEYRLKAFVEDPKKHS